MSKVPLEWSGVGGEFSQALDPIVGGHFANSYIDGWVRAGCSFGAVWS